MSSRDPSDQVLIERIRAGDDDAYGVLFARYDDVVRRRIAGLMSAALLRKVSVADVVQEARLVAFRRLAEFEDRGEGSFCRWLQRIAEMKVRAAVERHAGTAKRAIAREVTRGARLDTAGFAGQGPSPSQAAIGAETRDRVQLAMQALSADHRDILRLVIEEQLTLREAAARMGRSHEAAKKLYGRALSRFTQTFERLRGAHDA